MTTLGVKLCIPAALLTLVAIACSGGDDPTIDTTPQIATVPGSGVLAPTATGDIPVPVGTGDIPVPPPIVSSDLPTTIPITVTVGVDSGPARLEAIPLGTTVTLSVTNQTSDDEFHLHGYEWGDGVVVPAGQIAAFTFVANVAGEFELESHETGDILMILSVS
jgi:hypothetical protein